MSILIHKHVTNDAKKLRKQLHTLTQISKLLISGHSLKESLDKITAIIPSVLGVSFIAILLWDGTKNKLKVVKVSLPNIVKKVAEIATNRKVEDWDYPINDEHNLFYESIMSKQLLISSDLQSVLTPLMDHNFAKRLVNLVNNKVKLLVSAPMIAQNEVVGVLALGWEEQILNEQDRNLLETFANQTAIAIHNSRLYDQIQKQVEDLEIRNNQLSIINEFTNIVIGTLDVEKVAQHALDSIPSILGYLGALYCNLDYDEQVLRIAAYTQNTYSDTAFSFLQHNPFEFELHLQDEKNQNSILVRAINENHRTITNSLEEFLGHHSPNILHKIQHTLGIQSIVAIPIRSKNKLMGVLSFIIQNKEPYQLDQSELDIMSIIASQLGIALENANLYHSATRSLSNVQQAYEKDKDMIDILGHELRTPATVSKGYLELLLSYLDKGNTDLDYIRRKIESAYDAIVKESDLINELLTTTKLDSGHLVIANEVIDLYQMAKKTYDIHASIARDHGLELIFVEPTSPIPQTIGDTIKLYEVFDNLVSNGIKYTKAGSVQISLNVRDKYIEIHVQDSGNGIPGNEIPKLFQKFYRLNNYISDSGKTVRPGGSGLGLYVSKGIIEAHNGHIWVTSNGIGTGSTFSFSLPIRSLHEKQDDHKEIDMFKKFGLRD